MSEPRPPGAHRPTVIMPPPRRDGTGRSNRAGTVAAAAATLTAIVAVVIAIWDNVQTRRHNRLSVLPYVVIERVQQDSFGVGRGLITASNEGVGPAILGSLEIRLSLPGGRDTTLNSWAEAAPLIQQEGVQVRGYAEIDSGQALGVQRSDVLLRVQSEPPNAVARIQALFDRLHVRLRYSSVYGDASEAVLGRWNAP